MLWKSMFPRGPRCGEDYVTGSGRALHAFTQSTGPLPKGSGEETLGPYTAAAARLRACRPWGRRKLLWLYGRGTWMARDYRGRCYAVSFHCSRNIKIILLNIFDNVRYNKNYEIPGRDSESARASLKRSRGHHIWQNLAPFFHRVELSKRGEMAIEYQVVLKNDVIKKESPLVRLGHINGCDKAFLADANLVVFHILS